MKRMMIRVLSLTLMLALVLSMPVIARADSIDLGVKITTGTGEITVEINNSTGSNNILAAQKPKLTIDCDFEKAYVRYGNEILPSTLTGGKITFTVQKGGTYLIGEGDAPVIDTVAPVISGVEDDATYYTTQTVTVTDENLNTLTLNGEAVTSPITLAGNTTATYIIEATDGAGNSASVTVKMLPISSLGDAIKELTETTVTSADEATVEDVLAAVETLLAQQDLPAAEKDALTALQDEAEALLEAVEAAADALTTEDIQKVADKDETNVKLEDTADLAKAKQALEATLSNANKGNYTAAEQAAIQSEIDRLEQAIETIEQTKAVIDAIDSLPDSVEPDLEETKEKAIRDAKTAYNQLTNHQKSLMEKNDKDKLERLFKTLTDYEIVKGDGAKWKKDSDKSLSFTANGPARKFKELRVDDNLVASKYYTYKEGSTIVTLKASYLQKLSSGKHTILIVFNDGETDEASFRVYKSSVSPATGDNSNMLLMSAVFVTSLLCLAVLVSRKKGKYQK